MPGWCFPDIVKNCPKMRNLPKIFPRSFKNEAPGIYCKKCFGHFWGFLVILVVIMVGMGIFGRNFQPSRPHLGFLLIFLA